MEIELLKKIQAVKSEYELHGKTHLPNYGAICKQEKRIKKQKRKGNDEKFHT